MKKKKALKLSPTIGNSGETGLHFGGTIRECLAALKEYLDFDDGVLFKTSPVYTFEENDEYAQPNRGNITSIVNDLERFLGEGHGEALWLQCRDDGWQDSVTGLIVYDGSVLIEVEPHEPPDDE